MSDISSPKVTLIPLFFLYNFNEISFWMLNRARYIAKMADENISFLRVFFWSGTGRTRTAAAGFSPAVVKGVPSVSQNTGRGGGDEGLGKSVGVDGEIF